MVKEAVVELVVELRHDVCGRASSSQTREQAGVCFLTLLIFVGCLIIGIGSFAEPLVRDVSEKVCASLLGVCTG